MIVKDATLFVRKFDARATGAMSAECDIPGNIALVGRWMCHIRADDHTFAVQ